ncbi:histidine kinase [Campylobacter blaseri]|uniref:Histidine kinase n=1 Tax=Campylobacter blaseri TaxID=2042961 RepID=A0A2P8R481_9BACT|nr:histidine kinase [Campylobacter blaseri]PSM54781.1 histidine kinase [Campylobacter blaseri]
MHRPTPVNIELALDPNRYFISKTDTKGIITSVNEYFMKIAGYTREELIGKPHSIIRHPDMPKIIYKILWDKIQSGQNIAAICKNLAKDGKYYWVVTDFEINKDPNTGEIIEYTAYRRAPSRETIETVIPIYKELIEAEKIGGMEASEKHLQRILKNMGMSYDDFINNELKKSGLADAFKGAMKSAWGKFFGK